VALVETHEIPSKGGGIVELPSFTDDETSRPTVRMPPLADRRDRPASIDDAFDTGGEDREPPPADAPRRQSPTLVGVVPSPVPPRASDAAPAPIASEETLPIGGITRAPAPPGRRPASRA
jgi:hypothetical protein